MVKLRKDSYKKVHTLNLKGGIVMTEQVNPTLTNDWKKDRIASAHRGENPMVLTKMRSGFAVIGDTQFLPGYCLLLPFDKVDTLNDFNFKQRSEYLLDMSLIGDAIQAICISTV